MISQLRPKAVPRCSFPEVSGRSLSPIRSLLPTSYRFRRFWKCNPNLAVAAPFLSNLPQRRFTVTSRLSRSIRTEAEDALFDYLFHTRNVPITDAQHISRNSPCFLQKLLSKIDGGNDGVAVSRSLSRYLRYNPINEFEAFFESSGLNSGEISLVLPKNLMFLNDDSVFLENYHILCSYGVPRSAIGKMYKEAKEIFWLDHQILQRKIGAFELLGLAKCSAVKLISCYPLVLTGETYDDFLAVLEKLKCLAIWDRFLGGFLNIQRKGDWRSMSDTLEFLDKVGFSDQQVKSLFERNPELLFEAPGKKILALVGELLKLGLHLEIVSKLCAENPQVLSRKFEKNLSQALRFLADIGMENEDIGVIVASHFRLLGCHSYKRPRTVLRRLKIGRHKLCRLLKEEPLKLFSLAEKSYDEGYHVTLQNVHTKHKEKMSFLLRLGFVENSDEMAKALRQFRGRGDQLQERFDCLVEAGFESKVVMDMIKQVPNILNQTKDLLQKKIDWLRKYLGYQLESVAAFPSYLCYDLDRVSLRFSMYSWMREKGAAKPALSLGTILACSESRFIKYFVEVHPEGPTFWETLKLSVHGGESGDMLYCIQQA